MKYKALNKNRDLDPESCLLQAANALDAAACVAEEAGESAMLVEIAQCWMKFGEGIANFVQFQHETKESESRIETGFQRTDIIIEKEVNDRDR